MNDLFKERIINYFPYDHSAFFESLNNDIQKYLFLNIKKASKEKILDMIDFDIKKTFDEYSYAYDCSNISKTIVYDLGLIYPQDLASCISSNYINKDIKIILDLCSAPGGKSINILNKVDDCLLIANDISYKRCIELSKNLERLGLDNVIITNKKPKELCQLLKGHVDLVIIDAPCSGEGMIRKYHDILDNYSLDNIKKLASIQKELLEEAYDVLKKDGEILYSTCTYAFEEDEEQINSFLINHPDMELINIDIKNNYSNLKGTIKMCPLNNTEGQFIALLKKHSDVTKNNLKYLKTIKNNIVTKFIDDNLCLDNYYIYFHNDFYYISLNKLFDLDKGVLKYATMLGNIKNNIFIPSHALYRSNTFRKYFRYVYDLNFNEYVKYVSGQELNVDLENNYYLLTYRDISLGYGKVTNKIMKNKYPKGLRRMI